MMKHRRVGFFYFWLSDIDWFREMARFLTHLVAHCRDVAAPCGIHVYYHGRSVFYRFQCQSALDAGFVSIVSSDVTVGGTWLVRVAGDGARDGYALRKPQISHSETLYAFKKLVDIHSYDCYLSSSIQHGNYLQMVFSKCHTSKCTFTWQCLRCMWYGCVPGSEMFDLLLTTSQPQIHGKLCPRTEIMHLF